MIGMIGDPGTKRRFRFREMVINGWIEEMFVARKNSIIKLIQVDNNVNDLTRQFALVLISVSSMSLLITKQPDGLNQVNHSMKSGKHSEFVEHHRLEIIVEEIILKSSPVNCTESSQQVGPA